MPTVNVAVRDYVRELEERSCTIEHLRSVRSRLRQFTAIHGRDNLYKISRRTLARHFRFLDDGSRSEGTLAGYASTHKAFWKWCHRQGYTDEYLADRLKSYSYRPVVRRAAPEEDVEAVAVNLEEFVEHRNRHPRDVRDAAFVSFSIDSGARRKSILDLRWRDVMRAMEEPMLTEQGITYFTIVASSKIGPVEVVFFRDTASYLTEWRGHAPASAVFVFTSLRTGEKLRPESTNRCFERVCTFAGIPVRRSQAIRKRNTTEVIRTAGDLKIGQQYAGHRQLSTTAAHYDEIERSDMYGSAAELSQKRRQAHFDEQMARLFGLGNDEKRE